MLLLLFNIKKGRRGISAVPDRNTNACDDLRSEKGTHAGYNFHSSLPRVPPPPGPVALATAPGQRPTSTPAG